MEPRGNRALHTITIWWHFAPGTLKLAENGARFESSEVSADFVWESPSRATVRIHEGETDPEVQGWWSPAFLVRHPASVLEISFRTPLPFSCETRIEVRPR